MTFLLRRVFCLPALLFLGSCAGGGGGGGGSAQTGILAAGTFSISLDTSTLTVVQGSSATAYLTIVPAEGFSAVVDISLDSPPPGIGAPSASVLVSGVIALTHPLVIEAAPGAALETFPLQVSVRSSAHSAQTSFSVTVEPPPPPSFNLSIAPAAASIPQGSQTIAQLVVMPAHGFQGTVMLELESAPAGITADPLPLSIFVDAPTPQSATIAAAPGAAIGNHALSFRASSGALVATTGFSLGVADGTAGAPALGLSFGIKTFRFSWSAVPLVSHYKLFEKLDAAASFVQVGADLPASATSLDLPVALYEHATSSFKLQACNALGCVDSNEVSVAAGLTAAIGYFKASNTGAADNFGHAIALSADGGTLAISADDEDSNTTGIDGDQNNNSSANSGAVYLFVRSGPMWSQQAYVKASNTGASDNFGHSLALSADGSTLAVGSVDEDSAATGIGGNQADETAADAGAVYVFARSGSAWSQQAYVKASNTGAGDSFGYSVALSGDGNTLAVGAYFEDSNATGIDGDQGNNSTANAGAAYVFTRTGSAWSQQAYVKASNPDSGDHFGYSIALSADGNTLAVGADTENGGAAGINGNQADNTQTDAGAVYLFVRNGAAWSQQAYVKASNPGNGDLFGSSLALSSNGDTLAVGAREEDSAATGIDGNQADNAASNSGAAYLFVRSGVSWSQQAYVKASNTGADDLFGFCLSLSADGNRLAVGAYGEDSQASGIGGNQADETAASAGALYLFTRVGVAWSQHSYLKQSQTGAGDSLGFSISLSADGSALASGADFEDSNATGVGGDPSNDSSSNSGAAYLY